jgi:transcriptional regulator with XRE-family HTH domain
MDKSIFSREYEVLLGELREARRQAGLTQVELARLVEEDQPWVSRIESGERRLDVIELRAICGALGVPFLEFMARLEAALAQGER